MSREKNIALRDRREPGHFWADNEILDVFGDQLGHNGIGVYITLARFAYGSTVKLSLREIAAEARLGKDTVARALKVMADLGLVIERRAEKTRSVIQYDLANVKRLAAKVLKDRDQGSVVRDREEQGETVDHSGVRKADPPPSAKDDTRGGNLSQGETDGAVEDAARLSLGETDLSQTEVDFETDLSHRKGPCYRQDTRLKTQDNTPLPPALREGGFETKPDLGVDDALVLSAVRLVMRECALSDVRVARAIDRALRQECERTGEFHEAIARRMAKNQREYVSLAARGLVKYPVRMRVFFAEKWRDDGLWGVDMARLRDVQRANVGVG